MYKVTLQLHVLYSQFMVYNEIPISLSQPTDIHVHVQAHVQALSLEPAGWDHTCIIIHVPYIVVAPITRLHVHEWWQYMALMKY